MESGWKRAFGRFRTAIWYLLSIVLGVWTWKGPVLAGFAALIGFLLLTALFLWREASDDSAWAQAESQVSGTS